MNSTKIITGFLLLVIIGCDQKSNVSPKSDVVSKTKDNIISGNWEAFPLGDIDNDKISDTAFVYTPPYYGKKDAESDDAMAFDSCATDCYNKIRFSNKFSELSIPNSLWGSIEAIEDLDGDGLKELIFQTNWWIGNHVDIMIYSFDGNTKQWKMLVKNNVYAEDSYKNRVKKISNNEFSFTIEYMDTIAQDIMKKDSIVKIKK